MGRTDLITNVNYNSLLLNGTEMFSILPYAIFSFKIIQVRQNEEMVKEENYSEKA